ncbi:uncharacterized protein BHQ10_009226 [Talaromyces amestolkiae]|uniref:Uncharacterized protein n=1 Tax=Talaromyces amestolkiae TaxID=1196081 RepID=A0A364LBM8_TALAM|nr:uncharacterized protein BHQ10_009226 [Talaromyces amestolkiae]RAO73214.1 hypothetical protein BHQ10_009226 [Talaromyces amestolkiae]
MSEVRQVVFVEDNFDPLEVFLAHSKVWKPDVVFEALTPYHPHNDAQARAGFKCHNIFMFNSGFNCWVYAIVEQRVSNSTETNTITMNSLFNVDLTVKFKKGDGWKKGTLPFTNVGVVDVIECVVNNGTRAFVAALCILVDFKWRRVQYTNPRPDKWFERPAADIKAGLTIELASEFDRFNMPFRYSDSGPDPHYYAGTEYAIRNSARKNGFVKVNLVEKFSPDKSLVLYEDLYLRKSASGWVYVRFTVMNTDTRWPLTTNTPFTMELMIEKGTEEQKFMAKPYHVDTTAIYPWAVRTVAGCSLAFFGLSLPQRDAYEIRFFEEAFEDMTSVEVHYILTRQSLA